MKEYAVITEITTSDAERKMLSEAGYADPAINYYLEKKYMGYIEDADQVAQKVGSCGDIMKVYLKVNDNRINDVRYEITGCAGAISAAMAAVDLVKGKTIDEALNNVTLSSSDYAYCFLGGGHQKRKLLFPNFFLRSFVSSYCQDAAHLLNFILKILPKLILMMSLKFTCIRWSPF